MTDLDVLKSKAEIRKEGLKDLYDEAEGISAKVKLWFSINKKMILWLSFSHAVALIVGLAA